MDCRDRGGTGILRLLKFVTDNKDSWTEGPGQKDIRKRTRGRAMKSTEKDDSDDAENAKVCGVIKPCCFFLPNQEFHFVLKDSIRFGARTIYQKQGRQDFSRCGWIANA